MDLHELEHIINEMAQEVTGSGGVWQFAVAGVSMACMTDTHYDRMRVIAPIISTDDLEIRDMEAMLEANFHTALDARYATSHGAVYSAFIHPLSSLSADHVRSGIVQVASLVETFGTTFSGGTVMFGTGRDPEDLN